MEELLIPNPSKCDVATYNMLVEGEEVPITFQLLSLSIHKEANRVPSAKIVFRDGDASEQKFEISENELFVPGKKIQINIGRDGTNKQAFKGIITHHSVKVKQNGHSQLCIECQDESVKMTIGRHSHYFEKMKDSKVIDELITKYSLDADPEPTGLEHKELVQHHISDWDFMLLRAEANGMLVFTDDGKITVAKPKIKGEVLQVNYGSSILEFEAEMDARSQFKSVNACSWDYANQALFKADTGSATFTELGNISGSDISEKISPDKYEMHHSGLKLVQELQDWVDGIMVRSRLSKIRGRVKCIGFSAIKPGDTLKMTGVGARFNGKAYVTGVRQEMGNGIWETHIQFGLDPARYAFHHNDVNDATSAGLVGAIHGLQIGKVEKLENDPDGQDRIQVKIPVIDNTAQGIWTRVASLDAGADRGAFFRPEIGDEVIVGFINDDPRDAVLLGMLHSSNKPAPITAKDVNHEKGFTTRSKMHISFNDDTKTIKIDTPAGNHVLLDEKEKKIEVIDQNNNKLVMEPAGITMESPAKIDIKAGTTLSITAGTSLSIGAPSISVKADADLGLEGSIVKLKASGMAQINGSMVTIN
ncbi:MAG: type VI secretion system tip protein VgrG [Chitinophagaceae bacterium]|nr:type VI secretion system tip protein VgrG [Chitinophagaceae bacterium]